MAQKVNIDYAHDYDFDSIETFQYVDTMESNVKGNEIMAKRVEDMIIKEFKDEDIQVLNGRYGAYLVIKKQNYKIPKEYVPADLTGEYCLKIAKDQKKRVNKRY
mgnify:CR=1 FL=1